MSDNKPKGGAAVLAVSQPTEAITTRKRISDKQLDTSLLGKLRYELQFIRGRGALEIGVVFLVLLASFTIVSLIAPNDFPFLSPANFSGVLTQSIPLMAILAIGVGILMIAGEFDLSIGFAITLNAIVFVRVTELYGPVAGIFAGLASGVFVGLVNG
eukprot:gene8031-9916_t